MSEGLRNYNKVILVGRLTHTPVVKYTQKAVAFVRFNIAVNTKRGETKETLFIDIVAWQKNAEFCGQYFRRGKGIYVEGYLSLRKYKDENKVQHTKIEVIAEKLAFLEKINDANDEKEVVDANIEVTEQEKKNNNAEDFDESIPF